MASTRSTRRKNKTPQNQSPIASIPTAKTPRAMASSASATSVPKNARRVVQSETPTSEPISDALPMSLRTWNILGWSIVLLAALVRLWHLGLVPFHHDEGVNGNFLMILYRSGEYRYDPTNYHGPTLYYFALISARLATFLFGTDALNDTAMRIVPALFGVGTVWLVLCLRRYLGAWATIFAAAFVALSPGMVYVSRYFIHEMHFVFFTLAAVVAMLRFYETKNTLWSAVSAASLAMIFGSKETAPISLIVIGVALAMTWGLSKISPQMSAWIQPERTEIDARDESAGDVTSSTRSERRITASTYGIAAILSVAAFVFVIIVFFTSFGHNERGESIANFFKAYNVWRETGTKDQGAAFSQYLWWMLAIETPILVLGMVGIVWNLVERRNRFALFCSLWAGGLWLAYSLIPYKTPWLMLNWVLPLALVAGWTVQRVAKIAWSSTRSRSSAMTLAAPLFGVAISIIAWQSWMLNAVHYDDDSAMPVGQNALKKYPYVYVHTKREMHDMLNEIDRIAAITGNGKSLPIGIFSAEYWPLPWNLRNYTAVGFLGHVQQTANEIVIIGHINQDAEIAAVAGNNFVRKAVYPLRPGVDLVLWVRRDWADK